MESQSETVEFQSGRSRTLLRGRFIRPGMSGQKLPLVIMLTGDGPKGTKSLSWTNLPPLLQDRGIASFLFDFEGLGHSEGDRSTLTLSKGIDNFETAFGVACSQSWVDPERIGIFAASFGAAAALLTPHVTNRARMLGLKSPAPFLADAYINECGSNELDTWIRDRFSAKLGYSIDVLRDALTHSAYSTAPLITISTLVSHGDNDDIVPVQQSKYLVEMLAGRKHLEVFAGVGHHYSEEGAWDRMATMFVQWFAGQL